MRCSDAGREGHLQVVANRRLETGTVDHVPDQTARQARNGLFPVFCEQPGHRSIMAWPRPKNTILTNTRDAV